MPSTDDPERPSFTSVLDGQLRPTEAQCMNSCMGGVRPAWPGGEDMGSWPAYQLVELLIEGTNCILAFYYIGYILSGQIIMCSEIIIIWPLSVFSFIIGKNFLPN